jgi:hypothetical protein
MITISPTLLTTIQFRKNLSLSFLEEFVKRARKKKKLYFKTIIIVLSVRNNYAEIFSCKNKTNNS